MDSVSLTKLISTLIYPLGLMFCFAIIVVIARRLSFDRLAKCSLLMIVLIFLCFSNPWVAGRLAQNLKRQYPQISINKITEHDAIIVLGGGLRIPSPPAKHVQIGFASDRYWYAVQLFRAGKAKKIFLSGGNVYHQHGLLGEADYAKALLKDWGVPASAIISEAQSRTTQQNKENVDAVLKRYGVESALLVTSAIHMPRAVSIFEGLDIKLTPASADVLVRKVSRPAWTNYLPSAYAMTLSTRALHEYYGIAYIYLQQLI